MIILGIDPSTKMGLIVLDYEQEKVTTIHQSCYSSKQKEMPRLGDIGGRVLEMLAEFKPDLIALEGYSYGSKFNHEAMYSIGTVIRYFLWQSEYDYQLVPPNILKKFVTGKGNSAKDLILKGVYKNWGYDTDNDNLSDAYGLAMCVLFQHLKIADQKGVWLKTNAAYLDFVQLPPKN